MMVTKLVERETDAFKQKVFVVGVFLDLSKAFDIINNVIYFSNYSTITIATKIAL